MNKKIFSLPLIAAMTATSVSFAAESKKEETKTVVIETTKEESSSISSRIETIAAPMKKIANYIANNTKAALAVEVTGVLAVAYVVYNTFFAAQDEEEESFE